MGVAQRLVGDRAVHCGSAVEDRDHELAVQPARRPAGGITRAPTVEVSIGAAPAPPSDMPQRRRTRLVWRAHILPTICQ